MQFFLTKVLLSQFIDLILINIVKVIYLQLDVKCNISFLSSNNGLLIQI